MEAIYNVALISLLLGIGFFLAVGVGVVLLIIWAAGKDR
tara:strand:+ start:31734 stop:31850 length:117 start_codon:yes stop_codon:yes gene_type:complete